MAAYNDSMLNLRRRHLKTCKHRDSTYLKCKCPLWAVGTLDGEFVRSALDTKNLERGAALIREMEAGKRDKITVEDACARFIDDLKSRGLSPDTIAKFRLLSEELKEMGGHIDKVKPNDLAKLREKWNLKPSTAIKRLERLRSFFRFCVDRGWIEKNPAQSLRAPKETVIPVKPYDAQELEKIAWAIPLFPIKGIYGEANRERIAAFVAVLRWTGLRIRDVVQLRRDSVKNGYITLRTQKNGKPVKLPLHPEIHLEGLGDEYLFWSGAGNPKSCVGDWQRTFRRLGLVSGVHIHAHRWRHTFATDLLSKGVPVSEVAAILGNSPRIVDKHYSQWIQTRQNAVDVAVRLTWS